MSLGIKAIRKDGRCDWGSNASPCALLKGVGISQQISILPMLASKRETDLQHVSTGRNILKRMPKVGR